MAYSSLIRLGDTFNHTNQLSTSFIYSDAIEPCGKVSQVQIHVEGSSGDTDDVEVYQFNTFGGNFDTEGKLLGTITLTGENAAIKSFNTFNFETYKIGLKMEDGSSETPNYKGGYVINDSVENTHVFTTAGTTAEITDFTFTVKTDNTGTSNDDQFTLPLYAGQSYNCVISWGDETQTTQTDASSPTHTYASGAGTYTISISGTFSAIHFNNGGDKSKLISVASLGNHTWTKLDGAFHGCDELTDFANGSLLDTSSATDMISMFRSCSSLTTVDVSNFDTSSVTSMVSVFLGCSSLTTVDVSNFDTSSVTSMNSMFRSCSSLTTIDVSNFDTSSVTNMVSMFRLCSSLTTIDVSNFDTSSVTDIASMFNSCSSSTTIDVSNFDTSSVTNMGSVFLGCSVLDVDVSGFDITAPISSAGNMFLSSAFSQTNYDLLLVAWEGQVEPPNINFHAGSAKYGAGAPATARAALVSNGWTITDGGPA